MRYLFVISLALVFFGCKKAEDRRCFKGTGEEITAIRELDAFHRIFVGPNVRVVLVQDSVNKVLINAGKNLTAFITTDVVDGVLTLTNDNKCNFLRSYKHEVTIEVHFVGISFIEFEGTKSITCQQPISGNNLTVVIRDGAGLVDLDLQYNNVFLTITNGWGNFDLSGSTGTLIMDVRSNGFGSTYDLNVSNSIDLISKTAGLIKVNADSADCHFQLQSTGDVWYKGLPNALDVTELDKGKVIDKN